MLRRQLLALTIGLAVMWSSFSFADNDTYVPDSLKPWVDWVLEDNPHVSCPIRATDGVRLNCIWVRETIVHVSRDDTFGATFELKVLAFAESTLQLPYSQSFKPQNFTLNGQEVAIGGGNSAPELQVPVGSHTLKGELIWTKESEPRYLEIPRSGIVRLTIDGELVNHPSVQAGGSRLWFSNEISETPTTTTPDSESVRVFRHFVDDIPQTLTTYIAVTVTGNPRTLDFGRVIADQYQIMNLSSRWPAILSNEGNLVVQVSQGSNDIRIDARATDQLKSIRYRKASLLWPNFEYWGIEPRHDLRIIRMEGAQRTDLSQVNAPRPMRQLTGFVLTDEDELKLIEEQRGSVQPYASKFDISRNIWLNFRGDFFTVSDYIETDIATAQRVTSSIPLGAVRINGSPRLISYDDASDDQLTSIYLKPADTLVASISRVPVSERLPPNTWSIEAENFGARLHLPPGWMLLWSTGIDEVKGSWLSKWGIWDVFIVLLLLCLVWGLGGWKWTAIVAGAVLIGYQLDQAPTIGWVLLAGMCYALRAIKHVWLNKIANVSFWVVFIVVASACVFHASISMRNALHPQLAAQSPTFEEQVASLFERRYSAEDIERLGAAELSDFFRKIPDQFNSSIPLESEELAQLRSRGLGEDTEEVVITGSRMADSNARAMPSFIASDLSLGLAKSEVTAPPLRIDFDPTIPIAIQTGPGRPNWHWQDVILAWDGPVATDRKMDLVLLAPWIMRILYVLSALATLTVLSYFLYLKVPGIKNCLKAVLPGTSGVTSLVLLGVLCNPQDVYADIPDADLLQELENRLLALPDCLSNCAYLEEAKVALTDTVLTIGMQIHAEERVAIPLPNENGTWNLVDVRQGGNQLPLLRERSKLYTLLDEGVHDITLTANIDELNQLDIDFDLIPGHLEIDAPNWRVEGLVRGQVGDRKLTFNRLNPVEINNTSSTVTNFTPLEISPYVSVQRQILLTYEPTLITSVSRVAPNSGEITVRIPLLPNELVATTGMSVEDEHMVVNLKANQRTIAWESKLGEVTSITLSAPSIAERSERWSIIGSDFWNYSFEGVVPLDVGESHTTFIPRSDEVLRVDIQQTQPVPGDSITIGSVNTYHRVDARTTTSSLQLTILASQPGEIEFTLPEDASVESFQFGGEFQSLPANNVVLLPVQPGNHEYSIDWITEHGVSLLYKPPKVSFNQNAVNAHTVIQFPDSRWTVWLAGSSLGTTVAFWSVLIGVLFITVAISKIPGFALSTRDAVILTIGATLVQLSMLVFVGIWFLAMWLKSRAKEEITRPWLYRTGQVLLGGITLLLLYVLLNTIVAALTNDPNMYITGLLSSNHIFAWFSDEIAGVVPTPWVLSFPIWFYFVLILVWSMWLVFALLRWMRDWWQILKTPVLWVPIDFKGMFTKLKFGRRQHTPIAEDSTE